MRAMTVGLLALSATAAAQPRPATTAGDATKVAVASAAVHARCDESSPTRTMLGRGEAVVLQGFQGTWVQVRVVSSGEEGCMRQSALERVPAMDRAGAAQRGAPPAGGPAARAGAAVPLLPRAVISGNFAYQTSSDTFSDENTFDLYLETARYTSSYELKANTAFDIGGAVRLWRQLGAGVAVTRYTDSRDIAIEGTLPHPFFFQRNRPIEGTAAGEREELAVHVNAVYFVPAGRKVQLLLFGGPSFFRAKQSVVTDIDYSESYPFDTATFTRATVDVEEESKVGFNVGADVAYYFTPAIGVGGIVRFTRAKVPFSIGDLDAGGASVGGGVRIRIP